MLKKEGNINDAIIENMLSWHHPDFNLYIGDRIESDDKSGLGNLARYIIRACFSQESPLVCPKCPGQIKIISIIDDFEIIDKILQHLKKHLLIFPFKKRRYV